MLLESQFIAEIKWLENFGIFTIFLECRQQGSFSGLLLFERSLVGILFREEVYFRYIFGVLVHVIVLLALINCPKVHEILLTGRKEQVRKKKPWQSGKRHVLTLCLKCPYLGTLGINKVRLLPLDQSLHN